MLLAAITALAGVVALLYRQVQEHYRQTLEKLNECEDDRNRLWQVIAEMRGTSVKEAKQHAEQHQAEE